MYVITMDMNHTAEGGIIIDLCGFPKENYSFYPSQWTGEPMVQLLPHWTHPGMKGIVIPVWVYTNCYHVVLFLNEKPLGVQERGGRINLSWDVSYEPGILKAVVRRKDGIKAEKALRFLF